MENMLIINLLLFKNVLQQSLILMEEKLLFITHFWKEYGLLIVWNVCNLMKKKINMLCLMIVNHL